MTQRQENTLKRFFISNSLSETKIKTVISKLTSEQDELKKELEEILILNNHMEEKIEKEFNISITKKEREKLVEAIAIWG